MEQYVWHRWREEYINELQRRQKWRTQRPNVAIGALVLLKNENKPPTIWKMGHIEVVRTVSVRIGGNVFKRAIQSLCVLPNQQQIEDDEPNQRQVVDEEPSMIDT